MASGTLLRVRHASGLSLGRGVRACRNRLSLLASNRSDSHTDENSRPEEE
jgi:hypothetical protein